MRATPRRQVRGVSLIEAMVALAVMAFGTLSVLGVQGTLRLNADIAQQRSQALRIAQLEIEDVRRVATLAEFTALVDTGPTDVVGDLGNTTYSLSRDIEMPPAGVDADGNPLALGAARYKSVTVSVAWTDRTGLDQQINLATTVHGALPALTGTLAVPADLAPARTPGGRNRAIPVEAVDQGDGTSLFAPPGAAEGVRWRFDNISGAITRLCDGCDNVDALLLAGYVRYALTAAAPIGADAETPPTPAAMVGVQVAQTSPVGWPAPTCYSRLSAAYVSYYCAVEISNNGWSGRATLVPDAQLVLSAGNETDRRRVCRYTRLVGDPAVPSTANIDHPDTYTAVKEALLNQNYLVIRAGSGVVGSLPFACPGDDAATPYVNGQTWLHQQ